MRHVQVIASDMDGTLLQHVQNGEDVLGERTKEALIKAQQAGVRLILASGRAYPKMMPYAKELQMDRYGGWLVEINGTAVYDLANGKRKVFHQLRRDEIAELYETLIQQEFEVNICQDDALYYHIPQRLMKEKREYIRSHGLAADHPLTAGGFEIVYDNRRGYPKQYEVRSVDQLPQTMNKLCICDTAPRLDAAEILLKPYRDRLWWGRTTYRWMEVLPVEANKLAGVRWCCAQMGVNLSAVMAFGDGENDIELLKACGFGYAVGNALDSVKRIAYDVCDNNRNEGPAGVIERMLEKC